MLIQGQDFSTLEKSHKLSWLGRSSGLSFLHIDPTLPHDALHFAPRRLTTYLKCPNLGLFFPTTRSSMEDPPIKRTLDEGSRDAEIDGVAKGNNDNDDTSKSDRDGG